MSKALKTNKNTNTNDVSQPELQADDIKFDVNDIDKIEDPIAKEYALKAYKSFERGYQKKFQELAQEKREIETERESGNKWTTQRVQELLSNEEFINVSQQIIQSSKPASVDISDEDWSNLSDSDKLKIQGLQQRIDNMEHQSKLEKYNAQLDRENQALSSKYDNYEPTRINQIRTDMYNGKIQATNEHLYKAFYHDDNVKRAYLNGLEDGKSGVRQKADVSATDVRTNTIIPASGQIQREEGETSDNFLRRIMTHHLKNKRNK